jgi:hypothetical protein
MKRVIGYDKEGHTLWSENDPASARQSPGHGGELIRGAPGPNDPDKQAADRRRRKREQRR